MMRVYPFDDLLESREIRAGWIYFPLHFLLFPLLSGFVAGLGIGPVNLIYYGLGVVFLGLFMLPWLFRQYNVFCDRLIWCVGSMAGGYLVNAALSMLMTLLLTALAVDTAATPNNTLVFSQQGFDARAIKALAVFIAPVLEETLLRGVVFGSLRRRSRLLGYAVSAGIFSLCHVWQFALASGDMQLWVYVLQYIPASVALCYAYERSGSIWSPIMLHMFINALAFTATGL